MPVQRAVEAVAAAYIHNFKAKSRERATELDGIPRGCLMGSPVDA